MCGIDPFSPDVELLPPPPASALHNNRKPSSSIAESQLCPSFHPCSLSPLYNAALDKADYYDTSANTTEIGTNSGLPYGFFHHPMEGLPDGYPVLVSAAVSERRALQTLQYIQYGGFLNREATDTLTLKMILYNPAAIVFGYYSAALRWLASGEVAMTVSMQVRGA